MRTLETAQLPSVAGGDTVETNLGAGIGYLIHGVTSPEAQTFGMASPLGWFVGAAVHYATTH